MSIEVMAKVWKHSQHSGSELLLLLALADHAHDDGTNIYPPQSLMAKKVRMTDRSVRNLLNKLCDSGELVKDGHVETPNGPVVKYRIDLSSAVKGQLPRKSFPAYSEGHPGNTFPPTPEIASSDKPSVNRQLTTTNVVGDSRPKTVKKEDDINVYLEWPDDPQMTPEERAAVLLVRYNAEKGAKERLGVLGEAFAVAFGQEPTYNRLAALRSKYGVEPLAAMIYRLGGKDIVGDPMDYLTATLNKRGTGPNGWTPRMAWHPAGYRSAVPDEELTVSELWLKYPNEGGIPHAVVKRKRELEIRYPQHMAFEHRAHLAYSKIARPDWIDSTPGKELQKQYRNDLRRLNPNIKAAFPEDWKHYCEKFVPEEIRDQVREIEFS